jgi:hypothetical protein
MSVDSGFGVVGNDSVFGNPAAAPAPAAPQPAAQQPAVPQQFPSTGQHPSISQQSTTQYGSPAVPVAGPEGTGVLSNAPANQAPSVQQQISDLASSVGLDPQNFASFDSVDNARAAAQLWLESLARGGANYAQQQYSPPPAADQQQQQFAQQAPGTQTPPPAEFKLELDDSTDPKIVNAFNKLTQHLQSQIQKANQRAEQAEQAYSNFHRQQQRALETQVLNRANSVVDKLASAKYGVGANRNPMQAVALNNLYSIADRLLAGWKNSGQPIPQVEQILHQALLLDGQTGPAQKAAPQQQAPLAGLSVTPGIRGGNPTFPNPQRPASMPLDHDPNFLAGVAAILARP